MKIAQVNVYFKPFMVGGAEWYVHNVSRELVQRGHDVHVFTVNRCNGITAPESETIDGISVHRLSLSVDWSYRMKVWKGLFKSLTSMDFDVIHTYDYAQPHSAVAVKAGVRCNTGTVLTVFDIHSLIPRVWYKRIPMRLMDRFMAGRTLKQASKILVRAPNLVDPVLQLGGKPEQVSVTPSGVRDESLDEFDGQAFKNRYGITGSPVVLYVGRLNPLKGPQYLVDSSARILDEFKSAEFVFVGPDQSGYAKALKSRAANKGVSSHVHLVGGIYELREKMEAYSSCDVFVLPTSYEGTSQSIFEAMAQAKPVVATSTGGIPFQVEDGVEGLLVPYADADALSSAILRVLKNSERAAEMGSRGRKRVQSLTYTALVSELERIYDEVRRPN